MIKIYYDQTMSNVRLTYLLYPNFKITHRMGKNLFTDGIFKHFTVPVVAIVKQAEDADFILLPHNYSQVKDNQALLTHYIHLAKRHSKRLIIFAYGDIDFEINIPEALIFKNALHRFRQKPNEIKMPLFVEDLGEIWGVEYRDKISAKPSTGFCGWAEYASSRQLLRATVYHQLINIRKFLASTPDLETLKQGIYFRKKMLRTLEQSKLTESKVIRRSSFGLHQNTIGLSPDQSRREFVENIKEADFSLAIRGDMNDSARLYEIMSLGRIPVLLDTESVLPLEDVIDYSKCLVRIPYQDIHKAPEIVADFYGRVSADSFLDMQKEVRRIFQEYLRIDGYFKTIFKSPSALVLAKTVL